MSEGRLARTRATLPDDYQFGQPIKAPLFYCAMCEGNGGHAVTCPIPRAFHLSVAWLTRRMSESEPGYGAGV